MLAIRTRQLALKMLIIQKLRVRLKRRFKLDKFTDEKCKKLFRFNKQQILELVPLLTLPGKLVCRNGTISSGEEGLCILLRRLSYPNRLDDLEDIFYRPGIEIGMIFNHVLRHFVSKFGHLITDLRQWFLSREQREIYAAAIAARGAPLQNCWGFIDGTVRAMCRPSLYQRECYNGHKRVHSLKYQSISLPNGLIGNIFGPIEGRRHDSYMLSESNILSTLQEWNVDEPVPFCLYGDPAYPLRSELQAPYKGSNLSPDQEAYNSKMSDVRTSVEWCFGKVLSNFAFIDFKKNQKLLLQPLSSYFKASVLLTNIHTCYFGSATSAYFNLQPPSINEYLIETTD